MLGDQIELGRKSKDGAIRRLVQQVESMVDEALNYMLVTVFEGQAIERGAPIHKKLHNLPMNLHYGPSLVANNPGTGFDPSTVRADGGRRVIDPVSRSLGQLAAEISNVSALRENEVLDAGTWAMILKHLGDAFAAYKTSEDVFEESSDQWMEGAGDAWHKKGELTLYDVRHARPLFAGGAAPQALLGAAPELQVNKALQLATGAAVNVVIGARQKSVTHFCNRHTYAHFDRTQLKGVNIFWRAGTTRATVIGQLRQAIDAAWTHITSELDTNIESYELTEELVKVVGSGGLKRIDQAMYYRIFIPSQQLVPGGNADAELEIDMLAPTGPTYEAYERSVLAEVFG
jgi:hypothetical protein